MRPYAVEFKSPLELSAQGEYTLTLSLSHAHNHAHLELWSHKKQNKTTNHDAMLSHVACLAGFQYL